MNDLLEYKKCSNLLVKSYINLTCHDEFIEINASWFISRDNFNLLDVFNEVLKNE
jgi:hypothetical protein